MSPFTNVYGAARSLLAANTLLTLCLSPADSLFRPVGITVADSNAATLAGRYGLFSLLNDRLELARFIAIVLLIIVASGFRPRLTGVLHWWVSWSFFFSMVTQDGGDQCAAVLTFLLLPVTFADPRAWHWAAAPEPRTRWQLVHERIAASALLMIRIQVALLYLHAAVGKVAVKEWANGTAIYYWLLDTRMGVETRYHDLVLALLQPDWVAPFLTWAPMVLEFALFGALFMHARSRARPWLFWIALVFHMGNTVFFGLVSFMIAMSGALILLLRPTDQPYAFGNLLEHCRALLRRLPVATARTPSERATEASV